MEAKNINILLNISEIAIITGDNQYKSKRDFLLDFWKKFSKEDFDKYKKISNFKKETDNEIITKITSKNNLDITTELKKCANSKSVNLLNDTKEVILKKIENLPIEEKNEITKSITNLTNTKFGIKNEFDVLKIYELKTSSNILKDNIYRKRKVYENENFSISIGGKIDGINKSSGTIIEIKNRIHKLFYELRNYEKVQLMCYIYLFGLEKGHLVEALRKKDETEINIIELDFDNSYMEYIMRKIIIFGQYFNMFFKNEELKITIMKNDFDIDFI